MVRPKHAHPTPAELEVLKILWDRGPSTVREVLEALGDDPPRAYTSVMSLLGVMTEKKMLRRRPLGRAFRYASRIPRPATRGHMLGDLLSRVFEGSTTALVAQLLSESNPSPEELDAIQRTIEQYAREQGEESS